MYLNIKCYPLILLWWRVCPSPAFQEKEKLVYRQWKEGVPPLPSEVIQSVIWQQCSARRRGEGDLVDFKASIRKMKKGDLIDIECSIEVAWWYALNISWFMVSWYIWSLPRYQRDNNSKNHNHVNDHYQASWTRSTTATPGATPVSWGKETAGLKMSKNDMEILWPTTKHGVELLKQTYLELVFF